MNQQNNSKKRLLLGVGLLVGLCICLIPLSYLSFKYIRSGLHLLIPLRYAQPVAISPLANTPFVSTLVPGENVADYFNTAYSLTLQENYADAIRYWDLVISEMPQNGTAYYYRAKCYFQLTIQQNIKSQYEHDIFQALEDVDKAITYGVDAGQPGDPYYLRYQIFDGIGAVLESRSDRANVRRLGLQNLRKATILGTSDKYTEQWIPLAFFALGECQEGMNEIKHLKKYYGLSAPPSASMLNIEGHGYLCLEQLDKALEHVDRGLAIEIVPERVWLRSIILYLMGRNEEALNELNGLIETQPKYRGYRYYLRALIYYEKGEQELAESDLITGSGNTWGQGGLRAYVLGQMAFDRGDQEAAIDYLQYALSTLDWYYRPMFPEIERKLAALGAQPLVEEPQLSGILQSTPLPTSAPTSAPDIVIPTSTYGFPIPPNIKPIDMAVGTGPLQVEGNQYPYPVYLFQPRESVSLKSVENMTLHLEPYSNQESTKFEVFLWELKTGEWQMLKPGWGSPTIENPARFVDSNGDVYVAIRWHSGVSLRIKNIWLSIEATDMEGSPVFLGLER